MTRREFLMHVALVVLALSGIATLLKTVAHPDNQTPTSGFGAGPYGK